MIEIEQQTSIPLPEYNGALLDEQLALELVEEIDKLQADMPEVVVDQTKRDAPSALQQRIFTINHKDLLRIALEQSYGRQYGNHAMEVAAKNSKTVKRIALITSAGIINGSRIMEELPESVIVQPEVNASVEAVSDFSMPVRSDEELMNRIIEVIGTIGQPGLLVQRLKDRKLLLAQDMMLDLLELWGQAFVSKNTLKTVK